MAHFYTPANESHPMKLILLAMSILIVFVFSHVGSHAPLDPYYSVSEAVAAAETPPPAAVAPHCLQWPQICDALSQAGFNSEQVHMMVAIGRAESGLRIDAVGDQALENAKWGPSVGLWQIRTLKVDPPPCRDRTLLEGNLSHQAKCAYEISSGGQNYRPWSVYLSGAYKNHM